MTGTILNRGLFLLLGNYCSSIDKSFFNMIQSIRNFVRKLKAINVFNKNWYDYMSSSYVKYFNVAKKSIGKSTKRR